MKKQLNLGTNVFFRHSCLNVCVCKRMVQQPYALEKTMILIPLNLKTTYLTLGLPCSASTFECPFT